MLLLDTIEMIHFCSDETLCKHCFKNKNNIDNTSGFFVCLFVFCFFLFFLKNHGILSVRQSGNPELGTVSHISTGMIICLKLILIISLV